MDSNNTYQLVLEYLLDEGFASTEQAADKIILNMSEAWFEDIVELYKGKHGQSEKEYMDSRSDAGKQISGDSKMSGAAYSHRSFKGQGEPAKPGERQTAQGRMTNADRTELMIRKNALRKDAEAKALKKEDLDHLEENRRAARSAGGYKDDSKKQPDPSEEGFTGIGKMSIKDIMALNKKIEAKKKIKEELVSEEDFSEGARNPEVEEKGKKVGEYERAGKYKGITDKFREEHPGSREEKKKRGAKKSEGDQHADQRVFRNKLQLKYGRTKKQQREAEIMSKHTSPRD